MSAGQAGPDEFPRLGSQVGHYRLDALLGRGGMGVVFHATDLKLQRAVAVKFLSPDLADDVLFRERFVRESRLAAAIEHPAIVPIYEAGTLGDSLFIAMRYVPGPDLGRVLRAEAPLDLDRTLALAGSVADALDAAHRRSLVHRDVKPANVLTEQDGEERAYLTDFGLSRRIGDPTLATRRGPLGTIDYVAPEQVRGDDIDGQADQYALACLVMHCLTGSPPFEGDSEAAILYAQVHAEPPRLSQRTNGALGALDDPMARALSKGPAERYPACRAFVDALAAGARAAAAAPPHASGPTTPHLATSGPTAPVRHPHTPTPAPAPASRPMRSRRRPMVVAMVVVVAALSLIGVALTAGLIDPGASAVPESPDVSQPIAATSLQPGEVIVFASDRDGDYDLYALPAGADEPARLRNTSRDERSPAISPDGTTIAYVVGTEPSRDIWLMDIDGRRPRRLTSHSADDTDPAWSSDGKRLAFASRRSDPGFDIWEMRQRGGSLDESTARNITGRRAVEHFPAWHPGSGELAIASNHFGGNRDIFTIAADDGTRLDRLTSSAAFDFGPEVSPDGRSIAFYRRGFCESCPADRGQADIVVMNAKGRNERRLTRNTGRDDLDPAWSPDGRAIVYAAGPRGATELWVMESDGKRQRRLTRGWSAAAEPSWGLLPTAGGDTSEPSSP